MMFHRELDDRQLRFFGVSLAGLLLTLSGLAQWKWQASSAAILLCVASVLVTTLHFGFPSSRRAVYRAFTWVTRPFQFVATVVILGLVYGLVVTPIGLVLRATGRSIRKDHSDEATFWSVREKSPKSSRYFDTY